VFNILTGLLMLALSVLLGLVGADAFLLVACILSVALMVTGVRMLLFYATMARHMVGGKAMLYEGIIILDLGVFASTLSDVPKIYIVLYLLFIHAFAGAVDILRALEARRLNGSWRLNMASGLVNLAVAALCVVFLSSARMIVIIYSVGLFYYGCVRIVTAFRRTAVAYIQ
jgi:hypothetical protein